MTQAKSESDYAVEVFLQPYIKEQVKAEDDISGLLAKVKAASGTAGVIYSLDAHMGK